MSKKKFHSAKSTSKWIQETQRSYDLKASAKRHEQRIIKRIEERKKYEKISTIITNEILKRDTLQVTYLSLYPIIKELIENSKYLSQRFKEEDLKPITIYVVEKCHKSLSHNRIEDKENER